MKHKLKRNLFVVLLISFIGLGAFLYFKQDSLLGKTKKRAYGGDNITGSYLNPSGYLNRFNSQLVGNGGLNLKTRKDILLEYCEKTLQIGSGDNTGFQNDGIVYNPKRSVWLYNLCMHVDKNRFKDDFSDALKEFHKDDNFIISNGNGKWCSSEKDMNNCKLFSADGGFGTGKQTTGSVNKLYNVVLNDYFNLKQMGVYGHGSESTEKNIQNFSETYFGNGMCGDGNIYLNKELIKETKNKFCSHPHTYQKLKEYINYSKKLEEKLELVTQNYKTGSLFNTGFSQAGKNNWTAFKKLTLNELMWYNMFLTYYNNMITSSTEFADMQIGLDGREEISRQAKREAQIAQQEIKLSRRATYNAYRNLKNFYVSYPIHIAFMAYAEDIEKLKGSFKKIYTPIHQLYYKLRNVQKKSG